MQADDERVMLVANSAWYLWNFRRALIQSLLRKGKHVVCVCPEDPIHCNELKSLGVSLRAWRLRAESVNPWSESIALRSLYHILHEVEPSVIYTFTIKPNIYVGILSKRQRWRYLPTITGLGTAFLSTRWVYRLGRVLLRRALSRADRIFVQNTADAKTASDCLRVKPGQIEIVPGSGVDLHHFHARGDSSNSIDYPPMVFAFVGRFLRQKGICEYAMAARQVRDLGISARFLAFGDDRALNVSAVNVEQLKRLSDGAVEIRGWVEDVRDVFNVSHFIVLPSYREGMSRILVEAAAAGMPLVASDVPGCREIVAESENGFRCQPGQVQSLVECLIRAAALTSDDYASMQVASRRKSIDYSVSHVNHRYMAALH